MSLAPLPAAPSTAQIEAAVATHASALSGTWQLDLKRSDAIFAFASLMGAPWAIMQAMKLKGESAVTRALALSAAGLADTITTGGVLGNKTELVTWTWAPFERASPMGMPSNPASLSIDAEGRLVMIVLNKAKALRVETTAESVAREGAVEVLTMRLRVLDAAGKEALALRRVFTRKAA
jgi:hypothetical protein